MRIYAAPSNPIKVEANLIFDEIEYGKIPGVSRGWMIAGIVDEGFTVKAKAKSAAKGIAFAQACLSFTIETPTCVNIIWEKPIYGCSREKLSFSKEYIRAFLDETEKVFGDNISSWQNHPVINENTFRIFGSLYSAIRKRVCELKKLSSEDESNRVFSGKIFMPTIGDRFVLKEDWTFTVIEEDRNYSFRDFFESPFCGSPDDAKQVSLTMKKGSEIILDRVYIRKGKEDFDSLTFRGGRSVSILHNGTERIFKKLRFWVKLDDISSLEADVYRAKI